MIKLLPEKIISKIAAGELIQRPCFVLKELLENSIDAKAKNITVIIENHGKKLIKVIDDGIGMSINDAKISFKRFTTSKINNIKDLYNITTNGFRGEALYSISSISEMEIKTKTKMMDIGIHLFIKNNNIIKKKFISINEGTIVSVKNIFFNLPVRKNFLEKSKKEFNYIINEFYKISLIYFNIGFKFYNNKKIIFNLPPSSLEERIFIFYGKKKKDFIFFKKKEKKISFFGYISKPIYKHNLLNKENKKIQMLFFNNRFFKNIKIKKIIYSLYNILFKNFNFSYFIFFYSKPKFINYNINPLKTKIEIHKDLNIYLLLKEEIKNIIGKYNIFFNENCNEKINNPFFIYSKNNYLIKQNIEKNFKKINNIQLFDFFIKKNLYFFLQYKKYLISNYKDKIIFFNLDRLNKRILYEIFIKKKNYKIYYYKIYYLFFPMILKIKKNKFYLLHKFLILKNLSINITFYKKKIYIYSINVLKLKNIIYIINNLFNFFFRKKNINKIIFFKKIIKNFYYYYNFNNYNINNNFNNNFKKIINIFFKNKINNFCPYGKKIFSFFKEKDFKKKL